MEAVLKLNLADALTPTELDELLQLATESRKPLERLLYEAATTLLKPSEAKAEPSAQPQAA